MTTYSNEELERLLAEIESDFSERKESFKGDAPASVREAVCAFANDLPEHRCAGVVFIGAKDDGSPSGLPITDELLRQLADIKTDGNIGPPPTLAVAKRRLRGADMAVIIVEPADSPPVRYQGRVHIRIGPRKGVQVGTGCRAWETRRRIIVRVSDAEAISSRGEKSWVFPGK